MDADRILLMIFVYMLLMVPLFGWLILGGTGTINIAPGTFDTITFVILGFTLVMIFVVMPFFVLPRLTDPDRHRKKPPHDSGGSSNT